MSILNALRRSLARRNGRFKDDIDAAENDIDAADKRPRLKGLSTGGLPYGKGISPTGTPIDFTADEKPPRY